MSDYEPTDDEVNDFTRRYSNDLQTMARAMLIERHVEPAPAPEKVKAAAKKK